MYDGSPADHNALLQWSNQKCVPLVRELTFENAEVIIMLIVVFVFISHMSAFVDECSVGITVPFVYHMVIFCQNVKYIIRILSQLDRPSSLFSYN